jgi:hypothetical protein
MFNKPKDYAKPRFISRMNEPQQNLAISIQLPINDSGISKPALKMLN